MSTLFNITLESNALTGTSDSFDSAATDSGDLSVAPAAAMGFGNYGLEAVVDDVNPIYGSKSQVAPASNKIRLRYYLDLNTPTIAAGEVIYNLIATSSVAPSWLFTTLVTTVGGVHYLYGHALDDEGAWDKVLGPFVLNDAPHYIELYLIRESADGADDGTFQLWLDGVLRGTLTTVDNWAVFAGLTAILLGAITFVGTPTGTLYMDELKANDDGSEIGASIRPDLQLLIDGVNHISELVHESLRVHQTNDGLNSTCEFDVRDAGVIRKGTWTVGVTRVEDGDVITGHTVFSSPKVEVSVTDGATVYFAGILSRIIVRPVGQILIGGYQQPEVQILACRCHDFNALLEESVVDTLEEYINTTDEAVIDDIFGKYVVGIDFATHVDGGAFTFKSISFENITVRQAMDLIVARTNYVWYVDYSKKLHYSEAEANSPAWHLSDVPDQVNSFSYLDPVNREVDATNLVNMVFIVSSVGGTWFTDAASRAKYGDHKAIIRDERLSITESIAARGAAILAKFKDPITTYVVKTYKDGLRAGMHVRFVCAYLDVDDTFLISRLRIEFPVDREPIYELTLGGLESSAGSAAHRYILDDIISGPPISSSQLPLASRGWGHDLTFSATDDDTVAWAAGTITTAGGQTFAIGAGNTDDPGAMAAKTIVYLDTVISLTELQMTTDETAALGANRIMVAVCWPSGVATVDAGFQVFGATGELATYLNATNIIADSLTANEIAANTITAAEIAAATITATELNVATLSAITADMGTLTAGTIQTAAAGNDRVVINIADGIRGISAANVVQFQLDPADGVAYAGAGAVWLDKDGVTVEGEELADFLAFSDPNALKFEFDDSGTMRRIGELFGCYRADVGVDRGVMVLRAVRDAGAPWTQYCQVILIADDNVAGDDVRLYVTSDGSISAVRCTTFIVNDGAIDGFKVQTGGEGRFEGDLRVLKGLWVGSDSNPGVDNIYADADIKAGGGINVGGTVVNPNTGQLHFNSATYRLRRNGIHIEWYDGTSWVQLDNGP